MNTSREIKLCFEFDTMNVKLCNFNIDGNLILFCTCRVKSNVKRNEIDLVCIYSIEQMNKSKTKKTKCQKIYMIPKEAELISITKYNKIWLRLNNNLYEYDLLAAHTTMALANIYEVIIKIIIIIILLNFKPTLISYNEID